MKKAILPAIVALAVSASGALGADLGKMVTKAPPAPVTPVWDIAFGGVVQTDYNFRGISQSNRGPSGGAYFEPQLTTPFGTLYVGLAGYSIDWPSCTAASCPPGYGFTNPSAEIDLYGGWRNTWGQFSLDLGAIYYYYPKEIFNGATSNSDFWELYAKASYAVTPDLTVGGNVFWTPDLLNYSQTFAGLGLTVGKPSATYASGTLKWVTPLNLNGVGLYVSGELGHWWINDSGFLLAGAINGIVPENPSYTYYNAGIGFTYKAITLDLRYHGTDLGTNGCASFLAVGIPNGSNNWCNSAYIAALKFDTSLNALK
jgi:uncharacterized protein (TIGR02001 family)